jgi:hypothetical protein
MALSLDRNWGPTGGVKHSCADLSSPAVRQMAQDFARMALRDRNGIAVAG